MNHFSSGDMHHSGVFVSVEIPAFKSKNLELKQQRFPPPSLDMSVRSLLDIPANSFRPQSFHPSYPNTSIVSRSFRGSESSFPGLHAEPCMVSAAYNSNFSSNHASSATALLSGSHATLNGNASASSEPAWASKELELPSLQNQTGRWCASPSSRLPSLESVDTLIQTPSTENIHSCNLSSRNSGLLDAVLYESQSLKNPDSNTGARISRASDMVFDNFCQDPYKAEWEAYGESISPICDSTSVFSDSTPVSGNSVYEPQSIQHTKGVNTLFHYHLFISDLGIYLHLDLSINAALDTLFLICLKENTPTFYSCIKLACTSTLLWGGRCKLKHRGPRCQVLIMESTYLFSNISVLSCYM